MGQRVCWLNASASTAVEGGDASRESFGGGISTAALGGGSAALSGYEPQFWHGSAECHGIDRWDGRRYELRFVLLRSRRRCKWRVARRLRLAAAATISAGFERIMLARGQRFDCDGDGRSIGSGGGCELHRLRSRAAARRVEREAKDCLTKKLPQL